MSKQSDIVKVSQGADGDPLYVDSTNNRVGVGTSSPSELVELNVGSGNLVQKFNGATATFGIRNQSDGSFGHFDYTNSRWLDLRDYSSDNYQVFTGGSERMRIDSGGNVAINTTSPNTAYQTTIQSNSTKGALSIDGPATNGYWAAEWDMPSGSTYGILFKNGGSNVGNIRINAASTSYNTTSDHRLKENVTADWDATTRLKQLNPVRFNFIADADTTVDGFLAHEVQSVVPEAITGTHNEVDADGNPVYQGIDQSKLVPLLVKTIQELEARITALENGE